MTALIETVRVRGGEAPLWGLHLRRLVRACTELGVPFPTAFEVPSGGTDRVHRIEVGMRGMRVTQREVGTGRPVRLVTARTVIHRPYPFKTTDRAQFEAAAAEAVERGADDALMLTVAGLVAETSVWGIFWWEGSRLCAPSLDLGVLPGVARMRLGELRPVEERRVGMPALAGKSLFVANAVRGVLPVVELDGTPVPASPETEAIAEQFWA